MNLSSYDSTRMIQLQHDTQIFQETMDMLHEFSMQGDVSVRNHCIDSEHPVIVYSDYFADVGFSRG